MARQRETPLLPSEMVRSQGPAGCRSLSDPRAQPAPSYRACARKKVPGRLRKWPRASAAGGRWAGRRRRGGAGPAPSGRGAGRRSACGGGGAALGSERRRGCCCRGGRMVFESLVVDVLNRFLGDYVVNLDSSQLKLGIWGGTRLPRRGGTHRPARPGRAREPPARRRPWRSRGACLGPAGLGAVLPPAQGRRPGRCPWGVRAGRCRTRRWAGLGWAACPAALSPLHLPGSLKIVVGAGELGRRWRGAGVEQLVAVAAAGDGSRQRGQEQPQNQGKKRAKMLEVYECSLGRVRLALGRRVSRSSGPCGVCEKFGAQLEPPKPAAQPDPAVGACGTEQSD